MVSEKFDNLTCGGGWKKSRNVEKEKNCKNYSNLKRHVMQNLLCIELLKVEKKDGQKIADDVERKSTLNQRKRRIDSDERFTFKPSNKQIRSNPL
ncbi:hypothetical protein T05_14455 [Trichinella murrelli]|uniref:Uncharacterized protein n=1 Tax=Trichinella murrelli TaxID=144512 RepID=A0A0V0TPI2_9BILA|nr:hypothetical protein T05_14455 [Trichinella murrelli]